MKDILLITPPFTQLNTPYPATSYLKGFLNTKQFSTFQMDLGIEVILEIFSKNGLHNLFEFSLQKNAIQSENAKKIYAFATQYIDTINSVIAFLQGKNNAFAKQICSEKFLPKALRFENIDNIKWALKTVDLQEKAKYLATLYIEDLSDFIKECVDENFGFSRYAERLAQSANSFDELQENLLKDSTYIDAITLKILSNQIEDIEPKLVCFSIPFPGNLYSSFRCAQFIKKNYPNIKIAFGGGFPSTELRSVSDTRVFEYVDYIILDDGELALELLLSNILNSKGYMPNQIELKKTFLLNNGKVFFNNSSSKKNYNQAELGCPDYSDLLLDSYISVIEILNPMHSLWSNGRWNKLTMAHGCYWGKCTFCDGSLDYINLHEPNTASILVDRIEQIIEQTGERGFHFVDEAAPPSLMRALAIEIIKRKITITWWTNIRFEKSFTYDLCRLLQTSGCIAVSGGLEVASDRLLALINKGVTVEQVAKVTRNFSDSGIMVHAYLMYGFPSQTVQETINSLEMVRQMFELQIIQSGFWHQFALTAHSPIGISPQEYGILPHKKEITFANNDVQFTDSTGIDHTKFSFGLKKSLFNFMHGIGFEIPVCNWFEFKTPKTTISEDYIKNCVMVDDSFLIKPSAKILWLGTTPICNEISKIKHGKTTHLLNLTFTNSQESFQISVEKNKGQWLLLTLEKLNIHNFETLIFGDLQESFELQFSEFELFWYSKPINTLRKHGLLAL